MQYLYVDESFNSSIFVVGGVLAKDKDTAFFVHKSIKKIVKNYPLSRKERDRITNEYKAHIIERAYPQLKRKILKSINESILKVVCAYSFLNEKLYEDSKQELYIKLLSSLVKEIDDDLYVCFDSFGNTKFEERVVKALLENPKVKEIHCDYSYNCKQLQIADNVCGVVNYPLTKD